MNVSLVNIAENQESLWSQANRDIEKKQTQTQQQAEQGAVIPGQPLPGSSVNLSDLWRSIKESMKQVAESVSSGAQDKVATKKGLIELQKDSQIQMLNERAEKLEEQQKAQKTQGILGKIAMALGFLAAIVMAPFNPVMAAIMIGGMVAGLVIPKIADEIMKSAGVAESIRSKVKMGLEIAIGLGSMILSFNPGSIASSAGKAIASGAAKAATVVKKGLDAAKTMNSFAAISSKASNLADKVRKTAQPLLDKIQDFAKGGQMSAARIGQASSVGSNVTSVVSTGYGIKSADVSKQLEVKQAQQDELQTRIEQVLKMIEQAMRAVSNAFQSLADVNAAHRSFTKTINAIHM